MAKKRASLIDAQGLVLWDSYKRKNGIEVVERDDDYISGGPVVYLSRYQDWSSNHKAAIRFVYGNVLDIGCGAGRHSLHLQKMGLSAMGIDASPLAIKVCKLRGLKNAQCLTIDKIDRFATGSFDSVILLGNNFGLFGSFRKAQSLLKVLHRITSKAGRIIAETMDPHATSDPDHLAYHERNLSRHRMPGQIRLRIRHRKLVGPWIDYLFVSETELRTILKGTGWIVSKIIRSRQAPTFQYVIVLEKQ